MSTENLKPWRVSAATRRELPSFFSLLCIAALVFFTSPLPGQVSFENGDIFAAVGNGQIYHYDGSGNLRQKLSGGAGQQTGMCFDPKGRLFATNFEDQKVRVWNRTGRVEERYWGGPFVTNPESCVIDDAGRLLTGEADGERKIRVFDAQGQLIESYRPATEDRGTDWIDLAEDQCTVFYTSEGSKVLSYDLCKNEQRQDFASGLRGPCYALRLLPMGELMVACSDQVYRLAPGGETLQTYPISGETLFAMNLDPDGKTFWTAGQTSGNIYRVDIATGRGTSTPVFQVGTPKLSTGFRFLDRLSTVLGGGTVGGLAVFGEPTAAQHHTSATVPSPAQPPPSSPATTSPPPEPLPPVSLEPEARDSATLDSPEMTSAEPASTELPAVPPVSTPPPSIPPELPPPPPLPPPAPLVGITLREASAIEFASASRLSEVSGELDLSASSIVGEPLVRLTTNLDLDGVVLELQTPDGWQMLSAQPAAVLLRDQQPQTLPLRLRLGRCPQGADPGDRFFVDLKSEDSAGAPTTLRILLKLHIVEEPWYRCWWPVIAGLLGLFAAVIIAYGFISPSRFSGRAGLVLSEEEDMSEGFFYPFRAQRGSGSGFYRDARLYLRSDFCLSSSPKGALARLRAAGKRVQIQPISGGRTLRRNGIGNWEALPSQETPLRFGSVYCDELRTLFFELRSG